MQALRNAPAPGAVLAERERIRALLLRREPGLRGRIMTGPSGSLSIPSPRGGIEIGRMRRSGEAQWVVVSSTGEHPSVQVAISGADAARLALSAYRRR